MLVVLLSSLHHKHCLGLAVHLQLSYNEEWHMSITSIIRNIHFLRYDMPMFLFEMSLYSLTHINLMSESKRFDPEPQI